MPVADALTVPQHPHGDLLCCAHTWLGLGLGLGLGIGLWLGFRVRLGLGLS